MIRSPSAVNINFEYYKIFYYVAKYKQFTLAAKVLMTSQPSITRSIKNLEHDLGCELFKRSTKGAVLTPEGELLLSYIEPACKTIFKSEEVLSDKLNFKKDTLFIGSTETAIHGFLLDKLEGVKALLPNIQIKIVCGSTLSVLDKLKANQIDLAVVTTPYPESSSYSALPVCSVDDRLIGGLKFQSLADAELDFQALSKLPLIGLAEDTMSFQFFNTLFAEHGLSFNPDIEVATADLLLPFIKKNLGVGFIPKSLASTALDRGEVLQLSFRDEIPRREICLVRSLAKPESLLLRQFIEALL